MHKILEDLNWRYATKKFDPTKKLTDEQLHVVKESMRLTASSYGLQAYKVIIVESLEIREKLVDASYGQRPVADASHLFVFCANTAVEESDVDSYMNLISSTRNIEMDKLEGFSKGIKGTVSRLDEDTLTNWIAKQTYIALGQLMHTCASLRVDCLPMEGFNPNQYNEILGLKEKNLTATLVCPVGYRHEEDYSQHKEKVRKSSEDFFDIV